MTMLNASIFLAFVPTVFLTIALTLIFIKSPISREKLAREKGEGLDFSSTKSEQTPTLAPLQSIKSANGSPINFRFYKSRTASSRLIVLIHGSGWHSMQYGAMANYLTKNNLGDVVTPDLRGHGENPQRRGDVDYIGQLEDDIADLVGELKTRQKISQVIIAGHSSGGGLAIRLAGGKHFNIADGWILLAPFIKYNAPTMRESAGGWAHALVPRTVGLAMLNIVGITALNHLTSIQFNMPDKTLAGPLGHTATLAYSFRLNTSYAPRSDYGKDIAKIDKPMLLIAGDKDEAFKADAYEATISAHTQFGTYKILEGLTHINLTSHQMTFETISQWLKNLEFSE